MFDLIKISSYGVDFPRIIEIALFIYLFIYLFLSPKLFPSLLFPFLGGVTTYFDKVVVELNSRFSGNFQDVLCALGSIILGSNAMDTQWQLVSQQYSIDFCRKKRPFSFIMLKNKWSGQWQDDLSQIFNILENLFLNFKAPY